MKSLTAVAGARQSQSSIPSFAKQAKNQSESMASEEEKHTSDHHTKSG